jgi:hypothetical protein
MENRFIVVSSLGVFAAFAALRENLTLVTFDL